MRLIRFVSTDDKVYQGILECPEEKMARVIEGDIFERFTATTKIISVKKLLPPVCPPNILAVGLNYRKHADETNISYPDTPVLFIKATSALIGSGAPILLPRVGEDQVDYEAELAVVIGRKAKNIAAGDAIEYILGYSCANDVSARDWQIFRQKRQWARGKSFDTFCPLGPCLVTKDEIPDPNNLRISCLINGEIFQDSTTADMIFDVSTIVSDLSRSMTLLPGTVILTGTPEGVGFTREPPRFLKEEDVVSVVIEKIGTLKNPVKRE